MSHTSVKLNEYSRAAKMVEARAVVAVNARLMLGLSLLAVAILEEGPAP